MMTGKRTGKITEILPERKNEGKKFKRQDAILETNDLIKPTPLRFEFYDDNIDLMHRFYDTNAMVEIEYILSGYRAPSNGMVFNNLAVVKITEVK